MEFFFHVLDWVGSPSRETIKGHTSLMPFSGHDFPGKIDHLILVFDYGQISDPCILRRRQGKPDSIHQNGNLVNQPNLLIRQQVFEQDGLIGKGNSP